MSFLAGTQSAAAAALTQAYEKETRFPDVLLALRERLPKGGPTMLASNWAGVPGPGAAGQGVDETSTAGQGAAPMGRVVDAARALAAARAAKELAAEVAESDAAAAAPDMYSVAAVPAARESGAPGP